MLTPAGNAHQQQERGAHEGADDAPGDLRNSRFKVLNSFTTLFIDALLLSITFSHCYSNKHGFNGLTGLGRSKSPRES